MVGQEIANCRASNETKLVSSLATIRVTLRHVELRVASRADDAAPTCGSGGAGGADPSAASFNRRPSILGHTSPLHIYIGLRMTLLLLALNMQIRSFKSIRFEGNCRHWRPIRLADWIGANADARQTDEAERGHFEHFIDIFEGEQNKLVALCVWTCLV